MRYFEGKQTERISIECVACFVYNHFTCSRVYIREVQQRMKSKQTGEEPMPVVVHKAERTPLLCVHNIRMSIAVVSGYVASTVRTKGYCVN